MPPTITVPIVPLLIPNNVDLIATTLPPISVAITSSALNSQPMPTSPTGPPPPFPPPLSSTASTTVPVPTSTPPSVQIPTAVTTQRSIPNNNNDLNDAQNISKILQSLHNGSGSSSIGAVANHNNDKSKHDEISTVQVNNNKEEKLNNEKQQHHRAKRKSQQPSSVPKPATAQPKKSSSHVHTNGLISEKKSNSRIANGDDNNIIVDDEIAEKTKEENLETRSLVFREIRKLGRDYSGLYEQLAKVKGTFEMRFNFVQMCIDEASRFRRKHMADCIQEWWLSKCDENNVVEERAGGNKKK